MRKVSDILKLLRICAFAALFCMSGIGESWGQNSAAGTAEAAAEAAEPSIESVKAYYASLEKIDYKELSSDAAAIIQRVDDDANKLFSSSDIAASIQKLTNAANGQAGGWTRDEKVWKNYKTSWWGMGDSYIEDISEDINRKLRNRVKNGYMTDEEADQVRALAARLVQIGKDRATAALHYDKKLSKNEKRMARQERKIKKGTVAAQKALSPLECPLIEDLRAKYYAGCWTCLVVEKLSSAFMTAASKAYSLSQKAGLILLGIGSVMWLLMWGLRNVSSFTQLEPGNILNELIKFGFKIALAYTFIILGLRMVSTYFINPIMGVGARIAEAYWDPSAIAPYTEKYDWEDERVTPEQLEKLGQALAGQDGQQPQEEEKTQQQEESAPVEEGRIIDPSESPQEDLVQLMQNAFLFLLKKQWNELKQSCVGGPCSKGCRFASCTDSGHQNYVAKIHQQAGDPWNGKTAYCQASISSAMNMAAEQINAKGLLGFYNAQASTMETANHIAGSLKMPQCIYSSGNYTSIKRGYDNALQSGLLTTLKALRAIGKEPNIGSTLYVLSPGNKMGSGMHAVTYLGGGQVLSFNGDSQYNLSDTTPLIGVDVSCVMREQLKRHPELVKQIDSRKLQQLANGNGNLTFVNRTAGASGVSASHMGYSSISIPEVTYSGPTDIMSKAVMNSILGATKAITNITSENMILGDAVMCYATLDKGGAWHPMQSLVVTNFWMWIEGAFYWFSGMLLTLAISYYLLDMSFKIGFAVVALPIVVGLWPFDLTKDKFGICISIIAKAAATFAFLAITTTYTVQLTDAVFSYETDESNTGATAVEDANAPKGLARIYAVFDRATKDRKGTADARTEQQASDDIEYAANKLAIFSTTFVLVLFAFLYSFKLVQNTVPDLVNKFFPDKAFGNASPMHSWATAASKFVKDQVMKPVSLAADIAMYQGGGLVQGTIGKGVGKIKGMVSGEQNGQKGSVGKAGAAAGNTIKASGEAVEGLGKGVSAVGKGISSASQAANVIPGVGQAVAATGAAVGKAASAAGEGLKVAGKGMQEVGKTVNKLSEKVDKVTQKAESALKAPADDQGKDKKDEDNNGGGK